MGQEDTTFKVLLYSDKALTRLLRTLRLTVLAHTLKTVNVKFGGLTKVKIESPFVISGGLALASSDPALLWVEDEDLEVRKGPAVGFSASVLSYQEQAEYRATLTCLEGQRVVWRWLVLVRTQPPAPIAELEIFLKKGEKKAVGYKYSSKRAARVDLVVRSSSPDLVEPFPKEVSASSHGKVDMEFLLVARKQSGDYIVWVHIEEPRTQQFELILVRCKVGEK